jgi:VanZ family protein
LTAVWRWIEAWLPAVVWALVIFVLSSIPGTNFPSVAVPQADKIVHTLTYAVLGALAFRGARSSALTRAPLATAAVAVVITTLYGISDELHQTFTPNRTPDWHDVVADAFGGSLGALTMLSRPWMKMRTCFMMGRSKK